VIAAAGEPAVLEYLAEQEITPVVVEAVSREHSLSLWGFFRRNEYELLLAFTRNLRTLYRAGIPILRALSAIKLGPAQSRFNFALEQVRLSVQSGRTLAGSMAEFEDVFPPVYCVSVAAGEESGKLDDILEQLADVLTQELDLTRQIKAGIRYPVMVVLALIAAFLVVVTFVVPRFVEFYAAFNAELPLYTRLLIAISEFLGAYWPYLLSLVAVAILAARKALRSQRTRMAFDRLVLRIPIVNQLVIKGSVARFSLMFRILLQSGLPIVRSLDILTDTVHNSAIAEEITKIREMLERGQEQQLLTTPSSTCLGWPCTCWPSGSSPALLTLCSRNWAITTPRKSSTCRGR